jgi:TRAP-type C4-dicarboxylate transport system permease small subunit
MYIRSVSKIERTPFWNALVKFLEFGLILTGILVTCITFAAVIARAMNVNLLGYEEILIICAFWLYMFGTAYGSYEDTHIKADIIVVMMKEGFKKDLIALLRNTLTLILGFIFLLWALQLFMYTIENGQQTPVWRIPVTISQSSILFGLTVGSFYHLVYLYDECKNFYIKWIKKTSVNKSLNEEKGV